MKRRLLSLLVVTTFSTAALAIDQDGCDRLSNARIALGLVSAIPVHGAASTEPMLVGKTNIYCVQEPCPWRGIQRADPEAVGPSGLLWSEQNLPELAASDAEIHRLETAWSNNECLLIEGRFVGLTLQVERIVGECSP